MTAFKVGNLDGFLPHFGKVEGELKHLEITEGGNMVANTRYGLREYFLGNQRGATNIVDTQLQIGSLMATVVQTCYSMGHIVQAAGDFYHHEVSVVALGYRSHKVAFLDAGVHQDLFIIAHAYKG